MLLRITSPRNNAGHWIKQFFLDFFCDFGEVEHIYEPLKSSNQSAAGLLGKFVLIEHNNELYFSGSLEQSFTKVGFTYNSDIVTSILISSHIN